jgi:hypothetical protein
VVWRGPVLALESHSRSGLHGNLLSELCWSCRLDNCRPCDVMVPQTAGLCKGFSRKISSVLCSRGGFELLDPLLEVL